MRRVLIFNGTETSKVPSEWSTGLEGSGIIDFEKEKFQRKDVAATNKDGRF